MSWFILERDALEVFNKATNLNLNLNDLNNDFEYLFPTLPLLVHYLDWGLLSNIDRDQQ